MASGVQFGDRFVSLEEVKTRALRVTAGLEKLGLQHGDAVAIMMRNDIPFLEASMGTRNLGGYPVPLNWHLKADEVGYILEDSGAKAFILHADLYPEMARIIPSGVTTIVVDTPKEIAEVFDVPSNPDTTGTQNYETWLMSHEPWEKEPSTQTGSMIYTSGTTGRPKGVRRKEATPEQYMATIQAMAKILGVTPGLRTVIPAPLYHSAPNAYAMFTIIVEGFLCIQPRFDPEELLALIERHKIERLQMVPTMFIRLLKLSDSVRSKYDLSSLQYIIHAAAPCPAHVKQAMIEWWGPIISEYYGSTEMGAVTLCNSEDALAKPGTVGKAVEGGSIRIYDDDGKLLPAGEIGTIYCNLDWATDFTYQKDEEKRRAIERDGHITSGDIGYKDEDGFLFLCDRAHDMIISGGVNIYPAEIEGALVQMPGVRDSAVFGIPNDELGEVVAAVIEPDEGATLTPEDVQAFLGERLARFKVPRVVDFRSELPREDSGKLFKKRLRDEYWKDVDRNI